MGAWKNPGIAVLVLAACGGEVGSMDGSSDPEVAGLAILPQDPVVEVVDGESQPLSFEREVTYDDGTSELMPADTPGRLSRRTRSGLPTGGVSTAADAV